MPRGLVVKSAFVACWATSGAMPVPLPKPFEVSGLLVAVRRLLSQHDAHTN